MNKKNIDYKNQYNRDNYDRIGFTVPKGIKQIWEQHAKKQGVSLTGFICNAVSEYINKLDNEAEK